MIKNTLFIDQEYKVPVKKYPKGSISNFHELSVNASGVKKVRHSVLYGSDKSK